MHPTVLSNSSITGKDCHGTRQCSEKSRRHGNTFSYAAWKKTSVGLTEPGFIETLTGISNLDDRSF